MNNINTTNNDSEIEIDLRKIYLSLVKGIKWLFIIPAITVIIAVIYVLQSLFAAQAQEFATAAL